VLKLISWGASFRDPYAAFRAAISAQLGVTWTGGDSSRQIHKSAASRAQVCSSQAIPNHGSDTDFSGEPRRDDGHNYGISGGAVRRR
jgi:hypothetical protein